MSDSTNKRLLVTGGCTLRLTQQTSDSLVIVTFKTRRRRPLSAECEREEQDERTLAPQLLEPCICLCTLRICRANSHLLSNCTKPVFYSYVDLANSSLLSNCTKPVFYSYVDLANSSLLSNCTKPLFYSYVDLANSHLLSNCTKPLFYSYVDLANSSLLSTERRTSLNCRLRSSMASVPSLFFFFSFFFSHIIIN